MSPPLIHLSKSGLYRPHLISCPDDGIVVVEVEKGDAGMDTNSVPSALREQLGPEATTGLVRLFEVARTEWIGEVVTLAVERFERRLIEEIAGVRVEMAHSEGRLREEIALQGAKLSEALAQQGAKVSDALAQQGAKFSEALAQQGAKFSDAMAQQGASLRQEIAQLGGALRHEIVTSDASLHTVIAEQGATLRQEIAQLGGTLRHEIVTSDASLHAEIAQQGATLRQEMTANQFQLLKWAFLFWVGQVVTVVGLIGVMLRSR